MRSKNTETNSSPSAIRRKPPVLSITSGQPVDPDIITDADFERAVEAQDAVLFAQGRERRVLGKLRVRIERGAIQQSTRYYFDLDRGIVRRRDPKESAS